MTQGFPLLREVASLVQLVQRGDLPTGLVPSGAAPIVAVATAPSHPSNAVLVRVRRDGGPAQLVRGLRETAQAQDAAQWFQAVLPPLDEGRSLDYRVELSRAGQRLATLPADGSWLTLTGSPATVAPSDEPASAHRAPGPLWAYNLSFFATLTATLRPEVLGETPEGYRVNFFIESGSFVGPRIDAVLRRDGGDWLRVRHDGIAKPDIRVTLETADGALIGYQASGVCDLGPGGYAQVAAGRFSGSYPYYPSATWVTAHPAWTWLNRCQGFGIGRVVLEALQIQCDIYLPVVGDRLHHG